MKDLHRQSIGLLVHDQILRRVDLHRYILCPLFSVLCSLFSVLCPLLLQAECGRSPPCSRWICRITRSVNAPYSSPDSLYCQSATSDTGTRSRWPGLKRFRLSGSFSSVP